MFVHNLSHYDINVHKISNTSYRSSKRSVSHMPCDNVKILQLFFVSIVLLNAAKTKITIALSLITKLSANKPSASVLVNGATYVVKLDNPELFDVRISVPAHHAMKMSPGTSSEKCLFTGF